MSSWLVEKRNYQPEADLPQAEKKAGRRAEKKE